jgi:hypothetical protein
VVEARHHLRRGLDGRLLEDVEPQGDFAMQYSHGGYTTNLPVADPTGGKA